MTQEVKLFIENRINESGSEIALSPNDYSDSLFQKTLLSAGTGDGWYILLSNASLKSSDSGFTLTGIAKLARSGNDDFPCPYNGFTMEINARENDGESGYSICFSRASGSTGDTIKKLFPSLASSRVIDGGAMKLAESRIGDVRLEEEYYAYDTGFPDLKKESEDDTYPQPLYVGGYINLENSVLRKSFPFLPQRLKLVYGTHSGSCMLRFFERANPSFRLFATIENKLFDFSDLLLNPTGFGLYLTNAAPDQYATLEDSGLVSQVLLYISATLQTSSQNIDMILYSDLFQNLGLWNFTAQFPKGVSINQGIGLLFSCFNVSTSMDDLPKDVWLLNNLRLREIDITVMREASLYEPGKADSMPHLKLLKICFLVQSNAPWQTPVPILSFDNVGISIQAIRNSTGFSWHGNLFADFVFQNSSKPVSCRAVLSLPGLEVEAWLLTDIDIPLSEAVSGFLGTQVYGLPENIKLTDATFRGSVPDKSISMRFVLTGDWGFSIGNNRMALTYLDAEASLSMGYFSAYVSGVIELSTQNAESVGLSLSAEYSGSDKLWQFSGWLQGTLNLVEFTLNFFGTPPDWVLDYAPKIGISDLQFSYSTAAGNPMSVMGILDAKIPLSFLGTSFNMSMRADVQRQAVVKGKNQLTGWVEGAVSIGKFALSARAMFIPGEKKPSYRFRLRIDKAYVDAEITRQNNKDLLTISLGNMTVGEVIEFFVKLVNPNYDFQLDSPWDALGRIPLSGTSLRFDFIDKVITFIYPLNRNIGIASIGNLGFKYGWGQKQKGFDIIMTGSFLGQKYTENHPLSWDMMNEAPPQEASGNGKFELSFLALGEHVTYDGYAQKQVVPALDAMKKAMKADPPNVRFDSSTGLIMGLEAQIAGFLKLQAVFKQPELYGGLLTLNGSGAGSLSGLAIELFYTSKNGVGCFSVTFTAPYRFRRFTLGAVTIELGCISVQIYTNGGFLVDLGFPHELDFRKSFGVEVFPFRGKGGAYFGVMKGNSWKSLPNTNKGTFSPVVAFGLGMDIGIGKSFDAGILSASASASVVGVLEGTLAWFNPYRKGNTSFYYAVKGTVELRGNINGKVDFCVIAVNVGLNLSAGLSLTLRSAEVSVLALRLNVEAYASVRIIFVKVHFSFHLNFTLEFKFGKNQSAPWKNTSHLNYTSRDRMECFASHCGKMDTLMLCQNTEWLKANRVTDNHILAAMAKRDGLDYEGAINIIKDALSNGEKQTLSVWIAPYFTVADIKVKVTENLDPSRRVCFFLTLGDPDGDSKSLSAMVRAFLNLHLIAFGLLYGDEKTVISWNDLKKLEGALSDVTSSYDKLTMDIIAQTLNSAGIVFDISYPSGSSDCNGTAFPIPPTLIGTWIDTQSNTSETRDYSSYGEVDEEYVKWLRQLYGSFYKKERGRRSQDSDTKSSMAEHTFRGYFYILARVTAEKALEILETQSCEVTQDDTLKTICGLYPAVDTLYLYRESEDISDIAAQLGMSEDELVFLNPSLPEDIKDWKPGIPYTLKLGLTPQAVIAKNPECKFKDGCTLELEKLPCIVGQGDTLGGMTEKAGGKLSDTIKLNLDDDRLLKSGKAFAVPEVEVGLPHPMLLDIWSTVFYARIFQPELPDTGWYLSAILGLNPDISGETNYVLIPASYGDTHSENLVKWKLLPGDTPHMIAVYCALYQSTTKDENYDEFLRKAREVNVSEELTGFVLPTGLNANILPDETLRELTKRLFLVDAEDKLLTCAGAFQKLDILQSGRTLTISDAKLMVNGETAKEFSDKWRVRLTDLAGLIQNEQVLENGTFQLPVLYGLYKEELEAQLCNKSNLSDISGLLSRFLWNGQVVPGKFDNGKPVNLMGLYEKTGQQFEIKGNSYTFTLSVGRKKDWITLGNTQIEITDSMITKYSPSLQLQHVYKERSPFSVVETCMPRFPFSELVSWEQTGDKTTFSEIAYFPDSFGLYGCKATVKMEGAENKEISGVKWAAAAKLTLQTISNTLYMARPSDSIKALQGFWESKLTGELYLLCHPAGNKGMWLSQNVDKDKTRIFYSDGSTAKLSDSSNFVKLLIRDGTEKAAYIHRETMSDEKAWEEELLLLVVLSDETIQDFCNCAVIPNSIDTSSENVYAIEKKNTTTEVRMYPVKAGTAGYCIKVETPPEPSETIDPDAQARRIYSLVSFIIDKEPFTNLQLLLPALPQTLESDTIIENVMYQKNELWKYLVQLKLSDAISVEESKKGVPPASEDPYRAVTYANKNNWESPYKLNIQTVWHDLAGNRSEPEPALSIEFGYSDKLEPPLSYNSVSGSWWIEKKDKPSVMAALYFDCSAYMPDANRTLDMELLSQAAEDMAGTYYQISQPDISFTLGCPALLKNDVSLDVSKLYGFAADAWAYLRLLLSGNVTKAESGTLKTLCSDYGVDFEGLAQSNLDKTLETLLDTNSLMVPEMTAWLKGDTLQSLCGDDQAVYAHEYNLSLPLRPGVYLQTSPRKVSYKLDDKAVNLSQISKKLNVPSWDIAHSNLELKGVWQQDTHFVYNGITVDATIDESLSDIAAKFVEAGVQVTGEELAMEYEDKAVWKPELTLTVDKLAVQDGMTLDSAAQELKDTAAHIAKLNLLAENLFPAGTMLLTKKSSQHQQSLSFAGLTLENACSLVRIQPSVLLKLNEGINVRQCRIPGHIQISFTEEYKDAYFQVASQSLSKTAEDLNTDALSVFLANQALEGIIEENVELTVKDEDGTSATIITGKNDTLASLIVRFSSNGCDTTPEEIVNQNAEAALLKTGVQMLKPVEATFVCPIQETAYPSGCIAIETRIKVSRQEKCMHSDAKNTEAQNSESILTPSAGDGALEEFAEKAKAALPALQLCTNGDDGGALWAVVWDENHRSKFNVKPHELTESGGGKLSMPMFYSLRPLALEWLSRDQVSVPVLSDDGTVSEDISVDYEGIDIDRWAADFLEDMDWLAKPSVFEKLLMLRPELADKFSANRKTLACALTKGLALCLIPLNTLTDEQSRLTSAKTYFESLCAEDLSDAFAQRVVLQYDVESKSKEKDVCCFSGSVLMKEESGPSIYGNLLEMKGAEASYYQHLLVDAGNQYQLSEFSFGDINWQTAQLEISGNTLKPVLDSLPEGVSVDISSDAPAPLFLRRVPETPSILNEAQSFGVKFDQLLSWTADYSLRLPSRVQDQTTITLLCNVSDNDTLNAPKRDLFHCLAAFHAVSDQMKALILNGEDEPAKNAFGEWLSLADDVAESWKAHWDSSDMLLEYVDEENTKVVFTQQLVFTNDTSPQLVLERVQGSEINFPDISCGVSETSMSKLTRTVENEVARYSFPDSGDIDWENVGVLYFGYQFQVLNVLHVRNVKLQSQVRRNANISESLKKFLKVNEKFVYETPICIQESRCEPLARCDVPVDGGDWKAGVLSDFFSKLTNDELFDCIVSYSYKNGGFKTSLPVAGYLQKKVEKDRTLSQIEKDIADWQAEVLPSRNEGKWHFSLRVYDSSGNHDLLAAYEDISFTTSDHE